MQTEPVRDHHFEAMKDLTRLAWLPNFEALATVPPMATAVAKAGDLTPLVRFAG
jgi:hypothetical protein